MADIANWRPVSLLNTDYKVFAKLLANRLKQCIGTVIKEDQSYCVPGRSIYDNINLIRDVLFYSNSNDVPLAVINLDQKKTFDNVDHGYLFNTMRAMGFGARFISYLQILYGGAESLVKVCGSLTVPFSFEKGIRQGCPLSGLLYTIAIEPLLNNFRTKLTHTSFHLPSTGFSCRRRDHFRHLRFGLQRGGRGVQPLQSRLYCTFKYTKVPGYVGRFLDRTKRQATKLFLE